LTLIRKHNEEERSWKGDPRSVRQRRRNGEKERITCKKLVLNILF
jgi:hypothetical protein